MRDPDPQFLAALMLGILIGVAVGQAALADPKEPDAVPAAPNPPPVPASLTGLQVYNEICVACHAPPGIGGAPALGDSEAWAARIAQGIDTLIDHALHGFSGSTGIMPMKGGRLDLSDEEIIRAVEYLVASAQATDQSADSRVQDLPRIVVTTDPELDDLNSLVRLLLYSAEFRIEGLVYASSQFHWKGDGEGTLWFVDGREYTRFGLDMGPMESWRWPDGDGHIHQVVDAYEAAYPNLRAHDPNYPTPEYLRTIIRDGNIEFDGVFAKDTPGSDLIRSLILDDVPGPLYVMAWGGQSTIARALKSIQDGYEDTSEWEALRRKISNKLILLTSGDQDDTGAKYIRPVWPDVYPKGVRRGGIALGYGAQSRASAENARYYTAAWMEEHVSSKGALGRLYRVWGDGKGLVENDIFDYFGLSGYTDEELRALGYIVWTPVQEKGSWLGEGDTFTYLNLLNFGLRAREDDSYGGVGGYRQPASAGDTEPGFLGDGLVADGSSAPAYPDFFQVVQNDFAARLDWSTTPRYEDANHPPRVRIDGPADIVALPEETVRLSGSASDPDSDSVALRWWQFEAVDSYEGTVAIIDPTAASITLEIPDDAEAGQTIHVVLQATDDAPLPLTRYQRIIITVRSR